MDEENEKPAGNQANIANGEQSFCLCVSVSINRGTCLAIFLVESLCTNSKNSDLAYETDTWWFIRTCTYWAGVFKILCIVRACREVQRELYHQREQIDHLRQENIRMREQLQALQEQQKNDTQKEKDLALINIMMSHKFEMEEEVRTWPWLTSWWFTSPNSRSASLPVPAIPCSFSCKSEFVFRCAFMQTSVLRSWCVQMCARDSLCDYLDMWCINNVSTLSSSWIA